MGEAGIELVWFCRVGFVKVLSISRRALFRVGLMLLWVLLAFLGFLHFALAFSCVGWVRFLLYFA